MTRQYDLEQDLREAAAMVAGLERYLRGAALYGSVGGGLGFRRMPALTVGALALRLRRLERLTQGDEQRSQVAALTRRCDEVRVEWPLHYRRKALREANSRLDLLQQTLQEVAGDPAQATRNWPPELLRRSIVEELRRGLARRGEVDAALEAKLGRSDALLQAVGDEPCAFQWDPQLQPVYPASDFPWLYHRPRTRG